MTTSSLVKLEPGTEPEDDDRGRRRRVVAFQQIHTKVVPDPQDLLAALRWMYGEDGFYVEMRHNVYNIARFHGPEFNPRLLCYA